MNAVPPRRKPTSRNSDAQRTANDKRDAAFFAERKARDAANLAKTLKLKALRLAHEAATPKPVAPVRKTKKAAAAS